jgi:hypothetical protein
MEWAVAITVAEAQGQVGNPDEGELQPLEASKPLTRDGGET